MLVKLAKQISVREILIDRAQILQPHILHFQLLIVRSPVVEGIVLIAKIVQNCLGCDRIRRPLWILESNVQWIRLFRRNRID